MSRQSGRRSKGEGSIFQGKDGKYLAQIIVGYRSDGRPKRLTRSAKTRTEALAKLQQMQLEQKTGQITIQSDITFQRYAQRFLTIKKPMVKAKTFMDYQRIVEDVLVPKFGKISLGKLTAGHIDAFLADMAGMGLSPSSIAKYKAVLHHILDKAMAEGIISKNPVEHSTPVRQKVSNRCVISEEDCQVLLAEAKNISLNAASQGKNYGQSFFIYPILLTAYHTGMRVGEIFALRWKNVDLRAKVIHVRENLSEAKNEDGKFDLLLTTPKTGASVRDIDISDALCKVLGEIRPHAPETGIVFCTRTGGYIAPSNFARVWRKLLEKLDMKGKYTIHEWRHTHATLLMSKGINPVSISKRLGHAKPQTTISIYTHAVNADGRRMAKVFDEDAP